MFNCHLFFWYTSKIGGNKITENDIVTKDESYMLYAHWSKKSDTPKPTPKKLKLFQQSLLLKHMVENPLKLVQKQRQS